MVLHAAFKVLSIHWFGQLVHGFLHVQPQVEGVAKMANRDPIPGQTQSQKSKGGNLAIPQRPCSALHPV